MDDTIATQDIRGVLIQVEGARLLLPNAAISEVLTFAPPDAVAGSPDWLLGRIRWRGWQLPLVSFARLAGIAAEQGGLGSKVVVLKALGGNPRAPYFAVLTQGFPRLVTVARDRLLVDADAQSDRTPSGRPDTVLASVTLNDEAAWIPDLEKVETMVADALQAAA